jgi:NCAIR mutase (PurE)-related protein
LREVLEAVAAGERSVDEALALLFARDGDLCIDTHRPMRTGFPEVIFGQGKSNDQLLRACHLLFAAHGAVLCTRLSETSWREVSAQLPGKAVYDPVARVMQIPGDPQPTRGRVAVVSAGTSDAPVAREAALCASFLGAEVTTLPDVGVAGIHRLFCHVEALQAMDAVIAVAGMEGALPSVVGGMVRCPVIGVPTSVGYGAHLGGFAALLAMLNSCSAGVTVVNIDNGFGAATAAMRALA